MAKFNVENEHVEVEIEKLYKFSPELVYEAWTKKDLLKQWFMTSARTNKEIEADVKEGGKYRIVDQQRNGKVNVIEGIYESLVMDEYVKMTIGMPGLSETGGTQMLFYYRSLVEKERRFTNLEYKQKKKEYHDAMVHGFELMFDKMYHVIETSTQQ
ncbi:TPA: SRPBCC domain-containing protein [Staphylococcus aureus]|nr:SRPBCC domain-containing protein [Staphylococcus aureus]HCY4979110.1 SRPBCC domain-containing protein [Staphylococcus aureus]HCY4983198.1 SRPBCC domain-containing protein [Staphylococcus aureus]HCY4988497.1 SRPBCC domain-containing protein [Staphylococcus aureus]HEE8695721.1 SRPBCC domain-containing protein [Staphylococcus aureus]